MNQLNYSEAEQIKEIREIANELIQDKKLKRNKLANYLGLEKRQYSSFYKFIGGGPFSKFLEAITGKELDKFWKLLENPDLLQTSSRMEDMIKGYEMATKSFLVWIPLDLKMAVVDYNGTKPPLSLIEMADKRGIVTFRNTSKNDADGEIYIDHIGVATNIEPGTKIAIRRIDKMDWQPDRYYLIIDASCQPSIRELLPGDDEKTIRLVSTGLAESSHRVILLERIVAIFSFVVGNCIPKPKRNNISAPASQE